MDTVTRIRDELLSKNIKHKDLIEYLEVNQGTFAKWLSLREENRRDIPNSILFKIANYLNIDIGYLLGVQECKRINIKTIPLVSNESCGSPVISHHSIIKEISVSDDIARDGVYAVLADGDSMIPRIKDGDIVICDKDIKCMNGNIVHYTTGDGESGIKIYHHDPKTKIVTLYPLNTDGHFPINIDRSKLFCAKAFKIQSDL